MFPLTFYYQEIEGTAINKIRGLMYPGTYHRPHAPFQHPCIWEGAIRPTHLWDEMNLSKCSCTWTAAVSVDDGAVLSGISNILPAALIISYVHVSHGWCRVYTLGHFKMNAKDFKFPPRDNVHRHGILGEELCGIYKRKITLLLLFYLCCLFTHLVQWNNTVSRTYLTFF